MQLKQNFNDFLHKINHSAQIRFLVAICCVTFIFLVGYVLVIYNSQLESTALRAKLLATNSRLMKMTQVITATKNVQYEIAHYSKIDGYLLHKLSEQLSFAELLQVVAELAKKSQLELREVRPGEMRQANGFKVFPLELTFFGDFSSVLSFCEQMLQAKYFLAIDSMQISVGDNGLLLNVAITGYQSLNNTALPTEYFLPQVPTHAFHRNFRDPFVMPVQNEIRVSSDVTQIPCNDLQYLGMVQQKANTEAIVVDSKGVSYRVRVGEIIGNKKARVVKITEDAIITNDVSQNIYWRK